MAFHNNNRKMAFKSISSKNLKILRIVPIILLLFLASCNSPTGSAVVEVEIADNFEERSVGLMYREDLEDDRGMFFIFEESAYKAFWMKNTLITLDLIFISENFKVVDVKENFEPCDKNVCESYKPKEKAKYVLEVNAGFVKGHNIRVGDEVRYDGKYVHFGER